MDETELIEGSTAKSWHELTAEAEKKKGLALVKSWHEYALRSIEEMADMQDGLNSKIDPNWRTSGCEWYRAVWTECAELIEHTAWKWWKHQIEDRDQALLEIVDIWHFGLSDMIASEPEAPLACARYWNKAAYAIDPMEKGKRRGKTNVYGNAVDLLKEDRREFRLSIERLALSANRDGKFDFPEFVRMATHFGMTWKELHGLYIAKNVLNKFRQDHGYKTGEYEKTWFGDEDNKHLTEIVGRAGAVDGNFESVVEVALETLYARVVASNLEESSAPRNREYLERLAEQRN